jgi:hypothetical protein
MFNWNPRLALTNKLPFALSLALLLCSEVFFSLVQLNPGNQIYYNPVLPGWHSDPSCIQVNGTFFCVTSTFISFPGLPIYASKDLVNWKLVSHVWNRESQLPGISQNTTGQQDGMYAATLRYHNGMFCATCEYLGTYQGTIGVLFKSQDLFSDEAWSHLVIFHPTKIEHDLFWDNGIVYSAIQAVIL